FIAWALAAAAPRPGASPGPQAASLPRVGPGDDAAVLADGTVLCMDATVQGAHFLAGTAPDLVVRKALGRPLSDLCAMGAVPETVHVAALLPPGSDGPALAAALGAWCRAFGVALAGGDTKRSPPGCLAFAVAASGHCRGGAPWLRSGGRPGDRLWVSGPLGGAGGGRHLAVRPRTDIVAALRAAAVPVSAAMDLSDGLLRNLRQLCAASGCGAVVDAARVPVHADVPAAGDALAAALGDGEDYELLLALPPHVEPPAGLCEIGTLTQDEALWLLRDGARTPWPAGGYEHEF
ncbi:MAG TPA: thiamine-phosphate kinase, partial [Planctomycetota bacterium]|nr:thiamine-phosphate kinase [Planctomycetota bacterium]